MAKTNKKIPSRRAPLPSAFGRGEIDPETKKELPVDQSPVPCFNCGKPGSTCQDCGEVLCAECNQNPYAKEGHEPSEHLEAPPPPVVPPEPKMALQPFAEKSSCQMCGGEKSTLVYCGRICVPVVGGFDSRVSRTGEPQRHFHRTCERCGFQWLSELPTK
jgi:hypothetical protein